MLENFYFRNIDVGQVSDATITIDFNYEEGANGAFTPIVRNVSIDNLTSRKSTRALDLQGFANAPITNIELKDCAFENVASDSIVRNVRDLQLRNVRVNGKPVAE